MCGIIGEFAVEERPTDAIPSLVRMMARRGPDDEGIWRDDRCTLGFRRLAILDLSPAGHQPMVSLDGKSIIVFNGELYNFKDIKRELEHLGVKFRSTGDTEVVLNALAIWGTDALLRFNGMFALALYDVEAKQLLLARDHAGIKPLYYLHSNAGIVFASQYNQILAHPWSQGLSISLHGLGLYLRLGYIPAPNALFENTHMVEPGTWIRFDMNGGMTRGVHFEFPKFQEPSLFGQEALEAVDAAVTRAVRDQMISDVPIGTFLSGGIDSPLVAAKMRLAETGPLPAFTIGTNFDELDETHDASAYAKSLHLDHAIKHFTDDQVLRVLDDVIKAQSEPFGDYSMFPSLLVSELASAKVKVVLSGDGGDELFWGYESRFSPLIRASPDFEHPQILRSMQWAVKKYLGVGGGYWQLRIPTIGDWLGAIHSAIPKDVILRLFPDLSQEHVETPIFDFQGGDRDSTAQWLRWNEFVGHLTRVLLKVDRASMYHSLEVRVPLLDKRVIETALQVDWNTCLNIAEAMGKVPLRHSLAKHTHHQSIIKMGFSVPMGQWLKGPLKATFEERATGQADFCGLHIDKEYLQRLFASHLNGDSRYEWGLWVFLSLLLWQDAHTGNTLGNNQR